MASVLDFISYPDVPTVYGPISELLFVFSYWLSPANILPIKCMVFLSTVGLMILVSSKVSRQNLLIFCWCPLILFQFSLNAHIDSIAVLLLFISIQTAKNIKWWLAPFFLSLAIMTKIFALLAVPFILVSRRQYFLLSVILCCVYFPLLLSGKHEFLGLYVMVNDWVFNSIIYSLWINYFDNLWIKWIIALAFIIFYIHLVSAKNPIDDLYNKSHSLFLVYAVFILSLSAINPWYLIWFLAFSLFTNYRWPWVLATSVWCYLYTGLNTNDHSIDLYEIPLEILIVEYGLVLIFSMVMASYSKTSRKTRSLPN